MGLGGKVLARWGRCALAERLGDEHGQAGTLHQLGTVAEARGDKAAALQLYERAETIYARLDDAQNLAIVRRSRERVRGAGAGGQR